jgi:DNA polymerase-3 subunit epsilon
MRIAAIDFETANYSDASICAAGVAVFDDGVLAESLYWLIRPPKGHGFFRPDFIEIHGLRWFDVQDAPELPAIAPQLLERLVSADIVVAHNAWFDRRKLTGTLEHFGIACPPLDWSCTLQLSRRVWPDLPDHRLDTVAEHIHHVFRHHNAEADAEAAGRVMIEMMDRDGAFSIAASWKHK